MPAKTKFAPRAILKKECPFCLKLMIFLSEAGLKDEFRYLTVKGDTPEYEEVRDILEETLGEASFPTVEVAKGEFMSGSDDLIDYYAKANKIDREKMSLLAYFEDGVFPYILDLYEENQALKEQLD